MGYTKEQREEKEKLAKQTVTTQNKPDADQELIAKHPGLDAYELLQLGLSQAKYQELLNAAMQPKEKAKQNVTPLPTANVVTERQAPQKIVVRAQPQTRTFEAPAGNDMAWYIDPNGKGTHMSRKAAERLQRKTPGSKVV